MTVYLTLHHAKWGVWRYANRRLKDFGRGNACVARLMKINVKINNRVMGTRPHTPPHSFVTLLKSVQKKAPLAWSYLWCAGRGTFFAGG